MSGGQLGRQVPNQGCGQELLRVERNILECWAKFSKKVLGAAGMGIAPPLTDLPFTQTQQNIGFIKKVLSS